MPNTNEIVNNPVPLTDEAAAFVSRMEAEVENNTGQKRFVETDRFVAEQGSLYTNLAIVKEPNYDIPSQKGFGPSSAVELARLDNGRRLTWWVSNTFEQEQLKKTIDGAIANDASYPLEVQFVRMKKVAKESGNEYNKLQIEVVNNGDAVELPAVPDDQWTKADSE
tara:strand:- start:755 stop:1252 length:498 start_codon:yes stop_codon:yes gene_type:complete